MPEDNSEHNKNTEKLEKRELEGDEILRYVADAKTDTVLHRVAWILNHFPETRDSDITCQIKYWSFFEPDIYSPSFISSDDLYKLTKLTSIARARAKIQTPTDFSLPVLK